jgi:LPS sulfotransferase NodH
MNCLRNEIGKFIILYIGRCGSSYLQSLLNSHTDLAVEGELLHPGSIFRENDRYLDANIIFPRITEVRRKDKCIKSIGFKLSIEHLNKSFTNLTQWYDTATPCGIIHIYRSNKLEQYLSLALALNSRAWTSIQGNYLSEKISIDLDYLRSSINDWRTLDLFLSEFSCKRGGISISYESLLENQEYVMSKITTLLGVEASKLEPISVFKRQRQTSIKDTIENYQQVADYLKNVGLEDFLNDSLI